MFNSTLLDFDLRLLQGAQQDFNSCSNIFHDESAYNNATLSNNILDNELQMEEDEIGLLESSSDLQAFMNMASLPEVKDEDIDVEKVITDMTDFLQNYDNVGNQVVPANDVNYAINEDSKKETAAAVDILDELLKHNDITEDDFPPQLTSEDLPPEEMAAAEDILDELLKSGGMSLGEFDLTNEIPDTSELLEQNPPTTKEEVEEPNDSGFIDISNAQHITVDGQDIFIVVAPPSPRQPEQNQEVVTLVTAPESFASLDVSGSSDPDWTPAASPKSSKGRPPVKRTKAKSSRKAAPYIKDKKERKKLQNVEAARRYRDKKKSELNDVESEEQQLAEKNKGLKSEVADLEVKVRTMKQLMVELGILKQA